MTLSQAGTYSLTKKRLRLENECCSASFVRAGTYSLTKKRLRQEDRFCPDSYCRGRNLFADEEAIETFKGAAGLGNKSKCRNLFADEEAIETFADSRFGFGNDEPEPIR